jgi:hypothetical protein
LIGSSSTITTTSLPLSTADSSIIINGIAVITGTVPGTFTVNFRQNSVNTGQPTTVYQDSFIQIEQLA